MGCKIYAVRLGPDINIAAAAEAQAAKSEVSGVSTLFQSPTSQTGSLEEESSDSTLYAVLRGELCHSPFCRVEIARGLSNSSWIGSGLGSFATEG